MGSVCSSSVNDTDVAKIESEQAAANSMNQKKVESNVNEGTELAHYDAKDSHIANAVGEQFDCSETKCQHIENIVSYLRHHSSLLSTNNSKMIDFMDKINQNYTGINLMRDFIHIRTCHTNFTINRRQDIHSCNNEGCPSTERYRNRKLYTNNDNEFKNDIHEINLQQTFDVIHSNLMHDQTESNVNSSKFITDIEQKDELKEQTINSENYENLPTYSFGYPTASFTAARFIESTKYISLKEEFLSNTLYNIQSVAYLCLYQKAMNWMNVYANNLPKAIRESTQAPIIGHLKIGDEISIEHIMVIMSYTNMTDLQRKYKKGFIAAYKNEHSRSANIRFSEIGHWARLLYEAIFFFGHVFQFENDTVYHGISAKLKFKMVGTTFNLPTSTTKSLAIAQNFATADGVILELFRATGDDNSNLYLDVYSKYILTDYPNEQERLIYGTLLGFKNIIYEDVHKQFSHREATLALYLYQQMIFRKSYIYRGDICDLKNQNKLMDLMQQLMQMYDHKQMGAKDDEIDPYLLHILKWMNQNLQSGGLKMQKDEFEQLTKPLQSVFLSEFAPWLEENLNVKYEWSDTIKMKVTKQHLWSLRNTNNSMQAQDVIEYQMPNGQITKIAAFIMYSKTSQEEIDIGINARLQWPDQYASIGIYAFLEIWQGRSYRRVSGISTPWGPDVQFTSAITGKLMNMYDNFDIRVTILVTDERLRNV